MLAPIVTYKRSRDDFRRGLGPRIVHCRQNCGIAFAIRIASIIAVRVSPVMSVMTCPAYRKRKVTVMGRQLMKAGDRVANLLNKFCSRREK